ncbi:MAG: ATP-binding protein [Lachnospiraceae bacterium]
MFHCRNKQYSVPPDYDAVVANAILDRVLHHATIVTITGKSYRIT